MLRMKKFIKERNGQNGKIEKKTFFEGYLRQRPVGRPWGWAGKCLKEGGKKQKYRKKRKWQNIIATVVRLWKNVKNEEREG